MMRSVRPFVVCMSGRRRACRHLRQTRLGQEVAAYGRGVPTAEIQPHLLFDLDMAAMHKAASVSCRHATESL